MISMKELVTLKKLNRKVNRYGKNRFVYYLDSQQDAINIFSI